MSISANFPNVRPSLLLDFAQSQQLDPRVTFSRSTTALYYDGKTSVLAEQNTTLNSSSLSGQLVLSTGSATVTYNSTTAPDGTTTATSIVPTNGATIAIYYIGNGPTNSAYSYTVSIYVKANGMNYVAIGTSNASSIVIEANLSTGVVSGGSGSVVSAGNGWYRIIATFSSYNNGTYYLQVRDTSGTTTLSTANGTNGIYVWGAQSEQRSSVTAYNATTTSAITNYIPQLLTAPINAPRFDFNPTTGESLGLLIEQSSTNLLLQSQFASVWTNTNTTSTQSANIAPDGTQTAIKLVENSGLAYHNIQQTVSASNPIVSVYAKAGERSQIAFFVGGASIGVGFNLLTGATTSISGYTAGSSTTSITAVGNGWYRCSMTFTGSVTFVQIGIGSGGAGNYTGDGYSGIYIWGAQLEALPFATSYIPTTSAQVTRASDNASMTGTNFSSWYNQGQGTLYANFSRINNGSNFPAIFTTDSFLAYANSTDEVAKNIGANNQITITSSGTNEKKTAYIYSNAGYGFVVNGAGYVNNASPILQATFLNFNPSGNLACNRIKKFAYYPQALTSAQLQSLTGS